MNAISWPSSNINRMRDAGLKRYGPELRPFFSPPARKAGCGMAQAVAIPCRSARPQTDYTESQNAKAARVAIRTGKVRIMPTLK